LSNRLSIRWTSVVLAAVAILWSYPVVWTLSNALKTTADIYRGPLDLPWPPAIGNLPTAWTRANLGTALLNSAYVTSLTVAGVLALAIPAAYSLARLRPPGRALLTLLVLAPLIVPTEVLIVPLFAIYRTLGLINSLPGLALVNVAASVSFATIILAASFRRIPQDVLDAARVDGASRLDALFRIVVPLARPAVVAVAALVAIFAWNDFSGALVLLQRPGTFTAPLALTTFSTFYTTDEGLKFAGLAIVFLPPLLLFLVVQRSVVQGLTAGVRG
jgi:ABC-type glycerol-3-phosphate transport system permease component